MSVPQYGFSNDSLLLFLLLQIRIAIAVWKWIQYIFNFFET